MWMLLVTACAPPPTAEPDVPDDSAVDSAGDTAADPGDTAADDTGGDTADSGDTADTADTAVEHEDCRERLARGNGFVQVPDYEGVGATINADCTGTDHQAIRGIERVVFVGDSVTVGTPPNTVERFYRVQLAEWLADTYGLVPPESDWYWYDVFAGTGAVMESGDFAVCAKWGARTDDLVEDNDQIIDCIPEAQAGKTTLVVMTMGGNDLFSLADDYFAGLPEEELWASSAGTVQKLRDALVWLTTDKERFPGQMYVVFANLYEFTDGFGDVRACPGADLVGYDYDLAASALAEQIAWQQEELLRVSVETGTDMIFMGEAFCGHGYNRSRTDGRCYRDAAAELWFDESCFHPADAGHDGIFTLFQRTIGQ